MKEVEVHAWCDSPAHTTPRVEAVIERTVTINNGKPILLDLCATCDRGLTDLVGAGAEVREGGAVKPQQDVSLRTCPVCGRVAATRNAMAKHLRDQHDQSIREYKTEHRLS